MKKYILIIVVATMGFGCAGTKKVIYSPIGSWEYLVIGTPNGDASGTFILTQVEDVFKGTFRSAEYGDAEMENLYYSEGKMTCQFFIAGIDLIMNGTFEGETFIGSIDGGQEGLFPITANRIQSK